MDSSNLTLGFDNTTLAEGDFLDQLTKRCPSPPCIFSPQPSLTLEFLDTPSANSVYGSVLAVIATVMGIASLYVAYVGVFPNH
jgi:hypothetical protein